ncbi:putative acetyltransferase [Tolypothrix tenuis PCC 7101]|uniref:Putative acetyltransferase n=1 Tax=Tolypothrix tenuis PCC 7101 TaxID=231146 RepID=A0A1Z4N3U8_9CYAN|nr:GNAT family N-acetyltransferase [Aulosira sp. FACHB-113]BAZ00420.1 putative acetyltransferase [Tolypothrix tenuis PCC 7101]BAZ75658.1 putative acetyltransferase [Aulosira laxa NIES-50]
MFSIETKRLILREFQPQDLHQLAPILANPQVMKFSLTGILSSVQTQEKIDSFITSYKAFGFGKWAVIYKESNQLIGYCGIAIEQIDHVTEREIGYRLHPNFWGKGLATEAASATIQYGFEQFKFIDIIGIVNPANTASVRVLEKIGMKYEKATIFHGREIYIYRLNFTI